jgi:hypothetical protein
MSAPMLLIARMYELLHNNQQIIAPEKRKHIED